MALLPAHPGEALWIGTAGGKNHYNIGIGQGASGGQNHEDFDQTLIQDGYVDPQKFFLNAAGNAVMRINAGAGRTSTNTSHPRSELRELTAGGGKAAWDGRTGTHYVKARYRISDVSANRPWVCFTQIHGTEGISPEPSDLVRVQTEGDNGTTTNLKIVCRRSPPSGGSEIVTTLRSGYDVGDWVTCELGMYDGRLKIFLDGVEVLNVTGMGQVGNYFKTGCYLQDNVEKGSTANDWAAVEVERGSLVTWHSGTPNPTTPVFTGGTDSGGGAGGGDGTADTAPPTVPQNLRAIRGNSKLDLTWDASTDNVGVTSYNVYRQEATAATPAAPAGTVPWTQTYPDGSAYQVATGGTGTAANLTSLGSAVSGGVYNYTGSAITAATSVDFTGKSNITIKGIVMGQGGKLTPKAGTNIVLEVSAPYELSAGGETVKWVGVYSKVRIHNSLFGPSAAAGTPTTTKNRFVQFGDSTSVGAKYATVTGTTFRNKNGPGNMVHAVGDTAQAQGGVRYTLLTGNLFVGCKPFDENDHEANLMGISSLQLTDGQQVIEFNRYDDCRSEPEVISMKMNKSVIRGNTFHNCVGSLSLRHGDDGQISDNWVFGFQEEAGTGSYNRTSAGPRMYGARHWVHHNTIQVNGNGGSRPSTTSLFESPLTLDSGDTAPGSTSNGHANVVNVLVENNLLVKCGNPIMVVDNYGTAPTGTVRNNWIVECANAGTDGVGTKGSSPSKSGLAISGQNVYATTTAAGLTAGSGGHFVAPTAANRGARVDYLTATMVGQGATYDSYAGGTSGGGGTPGGVAFVLRGTTSSPAYTDTGLTNGLQYTYAVSAEDAAGNESALSGSVTASPGSPDTTAPSVPTGLARTVGDRRVALTWNASTDTESGVAAYRISRGGVFLAQVPAPATSYVDTDVVNGTAYSYTVGAVDQAGNASAQSAAVTATPAAPAVGGVGLLPGKITGGKVEVAVAWGADLTADPGTWTWTDITTDVRHDPGISTSLGRNDEAGESNPASLTVTLTNTTGAYSLGGRSPNYPNVRRNTPVRVRVDPGDGRGGRVLFWGSADGFTPGWDSLTGKIAVATLSASGTLRRLSQGQAPVMSAYRRAMMAAPTVVAYWPMEEGSSSAFAPSWFGGGDLTFTGRPDFAANDDFHCSGSLPVLKTGRFTAPVDTYPATGQNQVRWLMSIPDNGLPDGSVIARISTTGTINRWDITYGINTEGAESLGLLRYNAADGTLHSSDLIGFQTNGIPLRFGLALQQSGVNISWSMSVTPAQVGAAAFFVNGSVAERTTGIVSDLDLNPLSANLEVAIGHLTVENATTTVFSDTDALVSHAGESATSVGVGRLQRLSRENGVPIQLYGGGGELTAFDRMGPQAVAPLLDLVRECEATDQGQLWDGRNTGLSYTTRRRRELGDVAFNVNATLGRLTGDFAPVDDDQRNRNRVTVTRRGGVTRTCEDVDGPLGTARIGVYDDSVTINTFHDDAVEQYAAWFVHLGTVEGYRYPTVTIDLAAAPNFAAAVLDIVPGERFDVLGLDSTLAGFPDDQVSLIVEGIAHEMSPRQWRATFRCSTFSPWGVAEVAAESGDTSDMVWRLDTDGSTLTAARAVGATTLSAASTGALWTTAADDYPLNLDVGGVKVRATACTGTTSPQTFTVDALPVARATGAAVSLWDPRPIGLG